MMATARASLSAFPFFLGGLLFLLPSPAAPQGCLGLPVAVNRLEMSLGAGHQNQGTRYGGSGRVFAGGVFGLAVGAGAGSVDDFANGGYGLNVLLAVPRQLGDLGICLFGEYDQSSERIRNELDVTHGDFMEFWGRGGVAAHVPLARLGPVNLRLSGGPDLIWRVTELRGRKTYVEPNVHVLAIVQRETALHVGGRATISIRHRRGSLLLGLKNRPRRGHDLLWTAQLGIPF
jgi:hypothetical protein